MRRHGASWCQAAANGEGVWGACVGRGESTRRMCPADSYRSAGEGQPEECEHDTKQNRRDPAKLLRSSLGDINTIY